MKVPFTIGTVGHFGLAVRDPRRSAKWFEQMLGLRKEFEFEGGVGVGNDHVTIALSKGKPSPKTIGHMSFHLPSMTLLRKALAHLKNTRSRWKIRTTKSVRRPPAHATWAYGFTILTVTAGSFPSSAASNGQVKGRRTLWRCPLERGRFTKLRLNAPTSRLLRSHR